MKLIRELNSLILKYRSKPETSLYTVIRDLKELVAVKQQEAKHYTTHGTSVLDKEYKKHRHAIRKYKKEFPIKRNRVKAK